MRQDSSVLHVSGRKPNQTGSILSPRPRIAVFDRGFPAFRVKPFGAGHLAVALVYVREGEDLAAERASAGVCSSSMELRGEFVTCSPRASSGLSTTRACTPDLQFFPNVSTKQIEGVSLDQHPTYLWAQREREAATGVHSSFPWCTRYCLLLGVTVSLDMGCSCQVQECTQPRRRGVNRPHSSRPNG